MKNCSYAHRQVDEQPRKCPERMMTRVQWPCWRRMIGTKAYGNLLSTLTKITKDRRPDKNRDMSWNEDLLDVDHWTLDIWVVSFKTWSRRSLFHGRAHTCRSQSNVWNSRKPLHVTQTFETKILRSDWFCPGEPHQRSPNASKFEDRSQEGDRVGKSKVPAKQRGSWPKVC